MKLMQTGSMTTLSQRIARFTLGLGLAATLAFGAVMPTLAAEGDTTLTVSGSTLNITSAVGSASSATLATGVDKTASYNIAMTVSDARGTGAGWSVSLTSTTFTGTTGAATGHTLSNSASKIENRPSATCAALSTCAVALDADATIDYGNLVVPAGATAPTAEPVYSADADSGMGNMTFDLPVTIALPAGTTYAGTYASTVTVTTAATP